MKKDNKIMGPDFTVNIGKDELGNDLVVDISKLSNLFITGVTGSGKSNLLHRIITNTSSKISPNHLKFVLIDSKKIEFGIYNCIPHLLTTIISDSKKTVLAIKWIEKEIDRRLDIFQSKGVRDIESCYQKEILGKKGEKEYIPYIFVIIDDFSEFIDEYPKEIVGIINKIINKSCIVGINFIFSTSRIINKNIAPIIKSGGVRSCIVFKTANNNESRVILNMNGAERLETPGGILFQSKDMKFPICAKLSPIQETEIKNNINTIKTRNNIEVSFIDKNYDDGEDELYEEAKRITIEAGKASTSYIQRKLRIGYARSARLLELLEDRGIVGTARGAEAREVLTKE
jgi:DNA segregation ATPase FtsK/SpoIIIE, S-DNA-T family